MEYWTILLSIVISILSVHYLFQNYNFFKRHGVIHVPPIPILGSSSPVIFHRISTTDFIKKMYNLMPDAKYFGFYAMSQPVFLLRDPELIKDIFVKNFEAFPNRRPFGDIDDSLFDKNLFSLQGQRWKDVRTLLSPAFTSSKMKIMYSLMSECAVDFAKFLSDVPSNGSDIDVKDAFTKYTNDVIATCAFGIKIDTMRNPTNNFYIYGKDATDFTGSRVLKFLFFRSFPWLARNLGIKVVSEHVSNFFKDTIKTTIDTRDAQNIILPDMIQLMMDIRAHEIATHPDVQVKLRQEINDVLQEANGEVTYEAINKLKYLDAVVSEVLRLYPPVIFLERMFAAIHHDEKHYDNPEKFSPERFLDNNAYHNSPYYIPFGYGPRMCIANRFAILEVKVLLFHILTRCELKPCTKTTLPMRLSKNSLTVMAENGFWLNVQRRNDIHPTIGSTIFNSATTDP